MITKYHDHQQSRQLFHDSLTELWGKLSDQGFWANTKQQSVIKEYMCEKITLSTKERLSG